MSIASFFGVQDTFLGSLFGGNTASSLANLGLALAGSRDMTATDLAKIPLKGAALGIPMPPELRHPGLSGATGQVRNLAVQAGVAAVYNSVTGVGAETIQLGLSGSKVATSVAGLSTSTLSSWATGVGLAKFGWDTGTFLWGYFVSCNK